MSSATGADPTGNVLFVYDSVTDRPGTVLTASSEAHPVENLIDIQPGVRWRATGKAGWIKADAGDGSKFEIDTVVLVAHNGTVIGTWRPRISDSVDLSAPLHDARVDGVDPTLWQPAWGLGQNFGYNLGGYPDLARQRHLTPIRVHRLGQVVRGRVLGVDFADSTNAASYFEAGKIMAGVALQPRRNFRYGWSIRPAIDPSKVTKTDGGGVVIARYPAYREIDISIGHLDLDTALTAADDMIAKIGRTRPVVVVLFPDSASARQYRTALYGLLVSDAAIVGTHARLGEVAQLTFQQLL